jgi:Ca2+-binding RTX toxin-like protein
MSFKFWEDNHGDTSYIFTLDDEGNFVIGGESSFQFPDNCIQIFDVQGLDNFAFQYVKGGTGVHVDLDPNGGTTYVLGLDGSPEAKIICHSLIENVFGSFGNDEIIGNYASNTLVGGRGGDELTGCGGSDNFQYAKVGQSRNAPGKFDTITDYVAGEDWIDLHKIDANRTIGGNQQFDFIGNHQFSHTAGELRLTNNNVLLGDVNGDGHAELKIVVHGDHVLGSDILL